MVDDFLKHLQKTAEEMETFLKEYFTGKSMLDEMFAYASLDGGKRFRPALTLIFAQNLSGRDYENALKAAAAVEIVHAFSLVHDDMPCMDNDDFRRGKPSCHKQFGEAAALLAGDGMIITAFSLLASIDSPELVAKLTAELANGALKMVEGQYQELRTAKPTIDSLFDIHKLKTGALIKTSLRMGAIIAGKDQDEYDMKIITQYGEYLGLLFQLTDDVLDMDSNEECNLATLIGKTASMKIISDIAGNALDIASDITGEQTLMEQAVHYLHKRID